VLLLNDDYTPMEFVVHVLERFFTRTARRRRASCSMCIITASANAAFILQVAGNESDAGHGLARKHQHPLQCVMEKK